MNKALHAMGRDLQVLKDNLDTVAHAANILAVGSGLRGSTTGGGERF